MGSAPAEQLVHYIIVSWPVLTANQPEDQSHPLMCPHTQLQQGGYTNLPQGTILDHPTQVNRETVPLDPTEPLLHKTTLLRCKGITDSLAGVAEWLAEH